MQPDEVQSAPAQAPNPFSREGQGFTGYQGPPPMTPPPSGWRPRYLVEVPPPRALPQQNHAALDDDEARARMFTLGLGTVAGALLLVTVCALMGRVLF